MKKCLSIFVSILLFINIAIVNTSALYIPSKNDYDIDDSSHKLYNIGIDDEYLYAYEAYQILYLFHEVQGTSVNFTNLSKLNNWAELNHKLTREEAAKYIIESFGYIPFDEDNYIWNDENKQHLEFRAYIDTCKRLGITMGIGNNCFGPTSLITENDFLTMLKRASEAETELSQYYKMSFNTNLCKVLSAKYQKSITLLPSFLVDYFYKNDWKFILSEFPYIGSPYINGVGTPNYSWIGATSYSRKTITVLTWYGNECAPIDSDSVTAHEFGHFLQKAAEIDSTEVMELEVEKLIPLAGDYCSTNSREYFASAYEEYIINKAEFRNNCPITYDLIIEAESIVKYKNKNNIMM